MGVASCIIQGLCYVVSAYSMYRQPLCSKEQATWSQPHCEYERQQSVNDFRCCILYIPWAVLWHWCIIEVLAACIGNIVNVDLAAPENERQQRVNRVSTERQQIVHWASTECQQTVNNLGWCILYDPRAMLWDLPIVNISAAFMCKRESTMVTAPFWKWASTEGQRMGVLHLV